MTNPDGSTDTVYTNANDEVMLDDHYDPTSDLHWDTFTEYNGQGQVILQAAPSAVTGYNGVRQIFLAHFAEFGQDRRLS